MKGELSEHGHSLKSNQASAVTESIQTLKPSVQFHFGASKQWADSIPSISPCGSCFSSYNWDCETHGDVDAATNTTMDCYGGMCSSSSRGMTAAIHPVCHHPRSQGRPRVPDWVEQLSGSPLQMTHISFGTEPRLSYQALKSKRINKPNFSSWLQPQGSARLCFHRKWTTFRLSLAAGSCTKQTPRQLITSLHCLWSD